MSAHSRRVLLLVALLLAALGFLAAVSRSSAMRIVVGSAVLFVLDLLACAAIVLGVFALLRRIRGGGAGASTGIRRGSSL